MARGDVPADERAPLRRTFGAAVWTERAKLGMTQAQLAKHAGLSVRTIERLETGARRPTETTCAKLAAALRPGADPVTVAAMDLSLRDLAGPSLCAWNRRRPMRKDRQRVYAEAARVRAEWEARRAERYPDVDLGMLLAQLDPPSPDPWPVRRPAVRRPT